MASSKCWSMCLLFVALIVLDYLGSGNASASWEHLSLRYGEWYKPPRNPTAAKRAGYTRSNQMCKMDSHHGFLYVHPHNDKSRLIFDLNDRLAGIQTRIPGNMMGYNSFNESIKVPTREVMPPILLNSEESYSSNVDMYTVTVYFKHPSLICSPISRHAHPGKGLYIQMGYTPDTLFERIPLDANHLSPEWKTGICRHQMGRHYFKHLSTSMTCQSLYPVFLLYNAEGQLGGFGWLFQGTPPAETQRSPVKWFKSTPDFYPFIFDESMLPPCMFNPDFRIFSIRVYLRSEKSMTCPSIQRARYSDDKSHTEDDKPTTNKTSDVFGQPHHSINTDIGIEDHNHRKSQTTTNQNPNSRKYINSQNNNVIVDDVIRDKKSSATNLRTTLLPYVFVLCCFVNVIVFSSCSSLIVEEIRILSIS